MSDASELDKDLMAARAAARRLARQGDTRYARVLADDLAKLQAETEAEKPAQPMSDLDTIRAMFDKADVRYEVKPEWVPPGAPASGNIELRTYPDTRERGAGNIGYTGFITGFGFDPGRHTQAYARERRTRAHPRPTASPRTLCLRRRRRGDRPHRA